MDLLRLRSYSFNASADIDVDVIRGVYHVGIHYGGGVVSVEAQESDYAGWRITQARGRQNRGARAANAITWDWSMAGAFD